MNGTRASTGLGNVEDVVYCVDTGPNTIKVRALRHLRKPGALSNEIVLVC